MLSFEAPFTVTTNLPDAASSYQDFVQFMTIASEPIDCNSVLTKPDQRMITKDFTTRLHIFPPNSGVINCNAITEITVYDKKNNLRGTKQIVDKMGNTRILLMDKKVAGFSTIEGQSSTNRFRSIVPNADITALGHFMTYVPSTSEWVTGKTQFFSFLRHCFLEFYADGKGSNPELIKIDGIPLETLQYEHTVLPIFQNKYSQFIVEMERFGLHTIKSDGNYVAYVICKNVNGFHSAYGYLTGFNQRKSN
uniref:Adipocyte plasma membrane-associated protein n=1 Tax=Rhabditophanes sp. KR3021 TaxID=114890 RepID=A0AC35UB83_9BILA